MQIQVSMLKMQGYSGEKEMIANIKENPHNGNTEHEKYFDSELYKRRFKIEKANAWMDSFKALQVRFETLNIKWMSMYYWAFSILFLGKIKV